MRLNTRWSTTLLLAGLVTLAACDDSHTPLGPRPDLPAGRLAPPPSGLLAFYNFDQDAGNGDVWGATHLPTGGYEGGAYYFSGAEEYVDLPINVNPSQLPSMTMGAWVRAESIPNDGRSAQVLSHDDGGFDRSIALDPRVIPARPGTEPGYRFAAFSGSGVLPGATASTGTWTFVAAVYSAGTVTLYVNGERYVTTGTPGAGVPFLRVGGNPAGSWSGEPFHGTIDNVFVYGRALTEAEVGQIRTEGACTITGTCEAPRRLTFYPFDTGAGDGTVMGAVHQPASGFEGGAYYFDGNGAYIDLPLDVNPAEMPRMTMGAWVRVASLPTDRSAQVLSHDDGHFDRSIALDPRGHGSWGPADGLYRVSAFTGDGVLGGPLASTATWTFVAAVYDEPAGTVTLYADGAQYTMEGFPGEGVPFLRVGGNPAGSASGEAFHGWIDNVFVVNRALSADEIAQIHAEGACVLTGTPCNDAPTVDIGGPYTGAEGSPVALALSAADPDGDALSLAWDLGDGTAGTGTLPSSHAYANDGTYTVTLTATDPAGLSATASTTVRVNNVSPEVAPFAGASLVAGERYAASVSFTDPGADGWTASVDYGDGSAVQPLVLAGKSAELAHTYAVAGSYTVRVSVQDGDGSAPGTAVATVTVVGVGEGITRISGMVSLAAASGEMSATRAQRVTNQITAAATFLDRADNAVTPRQEVAMLHNTLRELDQALLLLPTAGASSAAARAEILRVRGLVQARLDALV